MGSFEIVDVAPPKLFRTKHIALHLEMQETMKKVPKGKSIRIGYSKQEEAAGYRTSLAKYLKDKKLDVTYFTSCPSMAENGKFYVWIGRRDGE